MNDELNRKISACRNFKESRRERGSCFSALICLNIREIKKLLRRRNFPFREQAMPFSRHLENF